MTIRFKTFGCRLNQYETECLASALVAEGHTVTKTGASDVLVVNSCAVTHKSDAKLRQYLRREIRIRASSLIVVTGCYASVRKNDVGAENVFFVTNKEKNKIPALIERYRIDGAFPPNARAFPETSFVDMDYQFHSRAFLKAQDGCSVCCNYCIVPSARGAPVSYPAHDLLAAIVALRKKGFYEFALSGINLGAYCDGETDLAGFAGKALPLLNGGRLRFSSIEPFFMTPPLIALFKDPRICAHAHIPLQSANNETLLRMGRRTTKDDYRRIVDALRNAREGIAITTDIMVGHPGETEAAFEETARFCEEMQFAKIHAFRYSKREGTPSADMEDQVPETVKTARARVLADIDRAASASYRALFDGKELDVVVETITDTGFTGLASEYIHCAIDDIMITQSDKRTIRRVKFDAKKN